MENKGKNSNQRGSTTVLMVGLLPVVLVLMGLSIDAGRIMAAKTELYKGTDVAAKELAENIDMNEAVKTGEATRQIPAYAAREQVEENLDGLCGGVLLDVNVVNSQGYVEVESRAEVPLLFSVLAGERTAVISVTSLGRLKAY